MANKRHAHPTAIPQLSWGLMVKMAVSMQLWSCKRTAVFLTVRRCGGKNVFSRAEAYRYISGRSPTPRGHRESVEARPERGAPLRRSVFFLCALAGEELPLVDVNWVAFTCLWEAGPVRRWGASLRTERVRYIIGLSLGQSITPFAPRFRSGPPRI